MALEFGPWHVAGPLIALLIVGLGAAAAQEGSIHTAENAWSPPRPGFRAFLFVGLLIGGGRYVLASGHVLLLMGSAIAVAAIGVRLPRAADSAAAPQVRGTAGL